VLFPETPETVFSLEGPAVLPLRGVYDDSADDQPEADAVPAAVNAAAEDGVGAVPAAVDAAADVDAAPAVVPEVEAAAPDRQVVMDAKYDDQDVDQDQPAVVMQPADHAVDELPYRVVGPGELAAREQRILDALRDGVVESPVSEPVGLEAQPVPVRVELAAGHNAYVPEDYKRASAVDVRNVLPEGRRLRGAAAASGRDAALAAVAWLGAEDSDTAALQDGTPKTAAEARRYPEWVKAMDDDVAAHERHGTHEWVVYRPGMNVLPTKWVFKAKRDEHGALVRCKARLTPKGFRQKHGVDYWETFAPVPRYTAMRVLMAEAARQDLEVKQADVPVAFQHADVEPDLELYMDPPPGYERRDEQGRRLVWRVLKTINGIKQGPRRWHKHLAALLRELGFKPCLSDAGVYVKRGKRTGRMMVIATWVDDLWYFYHKGDAAEYAATEARVRAMFDGMAEAVELRSFLGLRVQRDRASRSLTIDQQVYTEALLEKFDMSTAAPVPTPAVDKSLSRAHSPTTPDEEAAMRDVPYRDVVGSLLWLAGQTRPDIQFPVSVLTRFMQKPGLEHWKAAKRVLRYLRGTAAGRLRYTATAAEAGSGNHGKAATGLCVLSVYSDADWAADVDTRKSTTGFLILLNGNAVAWGSRKQQTVALSTAEAEYMGMGSAVEELRWIRQFIQEIGLEYSKPTVLHTDNQAARIIANGDVSSARTKHIDIRHHAIREQIVMGELQVQWVPTERQLADIFTKCLAPPRFHELRRQMLFMP
jgi:hypothetical protein